jgi:hypothetical protein
MNKSGVMSVGVVVLFGIFLLVWFAGIGKFISDMGTLAVNSGELTGLLAFFANNLNLFVFFGMCLGLLGYGFFGGGESKL